MKLIILSLFLLINLNVNGKEYYRNLVFNNMNLKAGDLFSKKLIDTVVQNPQLKKAQQLFKSENYPKALQNSLIVYNSSKEDGFKSDYIESLKLISKIYYLNQDFETSIKYYRELLSLISNSNESVQSENKNTPFFQNKQLKSEINISLANSYFHLYKNFIEEKDPEFEKLRKKIISIGAPVKPIENSLMKLKLYRDSTIHFYDKLEKIPAMNIETLKLKGTAYINLSGLYLLDSLFDTASIYAQKAIGIYEKTTDNMGLSKAQTNYASILLSKNKFKQAKDWYFRAIEVIKRERSQLAIRQKADLYYNIAWAMRNLEDYEAYDNLEISIELENNLKDGETKKLIKQAELKHFESLKKIENDKQIEIEKIKKDSTDKMLGGLTLLIIIISAVIIYNIKLRQKNLKLKLEQNKLVEKQKIDYLKSEAQVKILNATIDGKETERKQIAETLHDSVSALLSSANMHLRATKKQFNGSTPIELEKTQEIILEASQKVRDLSHNLVSSILLKFGLEYAIKDIAKKYSNTELHFQTEISNVKRYSQEFEIKLYNVIHELINNIIKHSKASNAFIIIEDKNDFLSVRIEDDGIGFNYKSSNSSSDGLGLNQIEARIQMMNGNFLVESGIDQGSKITFSVPVQKKSQINLV